MVARPVARPARRRGAPPGASPKLTGGPPARNRVARPPPDLSV